MHSLLTEIERFCSERKMTETQFGLAVLNDKNFVGQLREGRDVRLSTVGRVQTFIAEYVGEKAA